MLFFEKCILVYFNDVIKILVVGLWLYYVVLFMFFISFRVNFIS